MMWVDTYLELLIIAFLLALICIIFTILGMRPPKG